jgi:signal transduction histidine kinase
MLRAKRPPTGWSEFVHFVRPDGSRGIAQAINAPLPDGGELVVAVDRLIVDEMDRMLFELFMAAFGTLMLVNVGATLIFGRSIRHRFRSMGHAAAAIMAGDMTQRMPLAGEDRDLDRLSGLLNDMLERISTLVANLREISGGLAHDLRTPLTRLRAKLERAEQHTSDAGQAELIRSAGAEADGLLELFSAILAIAEIDGRSVRARFVPVDLGEAADAIVEAHRAAFEDAGIALSISSEHGVIVLGDKSLLQQLVGNLLDNILVHAPSSSHVEVSVRTAGDEAVVHVEDDGPGVPPSDLGRIFERLVRLDTSRSKPGHGLGLSIAAAITAAHEGRIAAHPRTRGLSIKVKLPRMTTM